MGYAATFTLINRIDINITEQDMENSNNIPGCVKKVANSLSWAVGKKLRQCFLVDRNAWDGRDKKAQPFVQKWHSKKHGLEGNDTQEEGP